MEEAVRKMTSLPAAAFRFRDRGMIREGFCADLTIFDPQTVIDKATFEQPLRFSEGIPFVLVNGMAVVKKGELVDGIFPGRAARAPLQ